MNELRRALGVFAKEWHLEERLDLPNTIIAQYLGQCIDNLAFLLEERSDWLAVHETKEDSPLPDGDRTEDL